jgi:6-pyruvoyltetrahydropterin/6-carboxytetrahydropterin synthase
MYRVSREIDFCYGHRLLNYEGKCRHLHGHNGKAIITIEAPQLDGRAMVSDFGDIKRVVSVWVDEHLDHRMILHRDDPAVPYLRELGEPIFLLDANPTAETIARLIYEFAVDQGLPVREVLLWETPKCYATYIGEGPCGIEQRIQVLDVQASCGVGSYGGKKNDVV